MLRSIVAVWFLALALLAIAATAGCGWGCANGDDCSAGLTQPTPTLPPPDMAQPPACSERCPTCAATETCFQPSPQAHVPAFCARACNDDRDCHAGELCAVLSSSPGPAACIAAGAPKSCLAGYTCNAVGAACADAETAMLPFSHPDDGTCGWEVVHCDNGCVDGACQ